MTKSCAFLVILFFLIIFPPESSLTAEFVKPRLILQITVDGLRGDLPFRYEDRYGEGGFRYFLNEGTVYTNAHYQYANNETIVGHTTLATGAFPSDHGMVGNLWLDQAMGELFYNIEDSGYTVVGKDAFVDKKTELDPTQRAARSDGRSPRAILTSTFSDELLVATNGKAKVFAVSVKDRGAVPMGGHGGKAFWFNKRNGKFISSTYYYDKYPEWVDDWNDRRLTDTYRNVFWKLKGNSQDYVFKDDDDRPFETDLKGYGRTFPHSFGDNPNYLFTFLTLSPAGDVVTLDFAKKLIENEDIGVDGITDYLSISLSSTDYVNHIFGPSSLEMEDNLLQLDQRLAELISYVDEKVGLENTLIVLAADHGTPEAPECMANFGMDTRRLSPERLELDALYDVLKKRYGRDKELIKIYYHPYIYLDRQLIAAEGFNLAEVEQVVADEIMKYPGIAAAISSQGLKEGDYINTRLNSYVKRNFHPRRSGDIYIIQESYNHLVSDEKTPLAAMHGSPWSYDTFVPIMFVGNGVISQQINRRVHPVDIAITLSNYIKIKPPSAAAGHVLDEIFGDRGGLK